MLKKKKDIVVADDINNAAIEFLRQHIDNKNIPTDLALYEPATFEDSSSKKKYKVTFYVNLNYMNLSILEMNN